jgi:hypothetical protein
MKKYIDREKVSARATLANAASVGGLLLLLASVLAPIFWQSLAPFALVLLLVGGVTSMVGIYLANRWVRRPRPEESLDKVLKSFDDTYRLYHYPALPCDHILLTPSGVVGLEVVNLAGRYTYHDRRWREAMTMGRALRYLVEPRVGDPFVVAEGMSEELSRWIKEHCSSATAVPVKILTVFTHPSVELEFDSPSVPAYNVDKLRKHIALSAAKMPAKSYEELAAALERVTLA